MLDPDHPLAQLVRRDRRYSLEAYQFVYDALRFAQEKLHLGSDRPSEPLEGKARRQRQEGGERHLTGQELCEAARLLALEQFGYMAKCVLNSWGVRQTGDFGEIVYNLIGIGLMRKTKEDRREDFDDVYEFESGLSESFSITMPE